MSRDNKERLLSKGIVNFQLNKCPDAEAFPCAHGFIIVLGVRPLSRPTEYRVPPLSIYIYIYNFFFFLFEKKYVINSNWECNEFVNI